jgi:protein-S-isoprenylcysteine O-methyltransferase Ste14
MWKTTLLAILVTPVFLAVTGALMFVSAGRWDLPLFWAHLGVWAAAAVVGLLIIDPTLTQERLQPGPGGKDWLTGIVVIPLWLGLYIVAGLDVGRFHWSDTVPLAVQVAGLVAMAAGVAVVNWAAAVNRFASTVVRIQTERGHHVITTGPYRWVRHPMYTACFLMFPGGTLALGSWLALLFALGIVGLILRRTAFEDRVLHEQLEGYAAYAQKVRYRLIPGVW